MKGLLIKDFKLLADRKRFILLVMVLSIWMHFVLYNPTFIIGYVIFILCILAVNTIGYDEEDNGYAVLFTLPFSRKEYAVEKYLFGSLLCLMGGAFATVLCFIGMNVKDVAYDMEKVLSTAVITFAVVMMIMSFLIPIRFLSGNARYKFALTLAMAIPLAGVIYVGGNILMGVRFMNFCSLFEGMRSAMLAGIVMAIAMAVMLTSIVISAAIIERKAL